MRSVHGNVSWRADSFRIRRVSFLCTRHVVGVDVFPSVLLVLALIHVSSFPREKGVLLVYPVHFKMCSISRTIAFQTVKNIMPHDMTWRKASCVSLSPFWQQSNVAHSQKRQVFGYDHESLSLNSGEFRYRGSQNNASKQGSGQGLEKWQQLMGATLETSWAEAFPSLLVGYETQWEWPIFTEKKKIGHTFQVIPQFCG